MSNKQKLELTWIGKDEELKLEPRILIEDPAKSYGDPKSENMLIHGDNLLALKALEQDFAGKIKSVFIDPPYNTGSAFSHYDDGLEHSIWLSLMKPRIEIIWKLLSDEGSLWITIDDNESHYLKILCDEIFGRTNFVANVVWQKKSSPQANATWLSESHDHILVFAKNKSSFRPNKLPRTVEQNSIYKHSDEFDGINEKGDMYGRGTWFPGDFTLSLASGQRGKQYAKTGESENIYPIITPSGNEVWPAKGRAWAYVKTSYEKLLADHRVYFGKKGDSKPTIKRFLLEIQDDGVVPMTTWHYSEVGENRSAAQEIKQFNPDDPFSTPKPEKLIERILLLSTNKGDLVLDSFLGSGTTSAVAHKMNRKWIGVELGEHATTHCIPRLRSVIDGTDQGGVTEALGWKNGGGFKFYNLAPSLLKKDSYDRWIIDEQYNANMLAAAVCKHEGFKFSPNEEVYWKHGGSTETDFIFVTTTFITVEQMDKIYNEMRDGESLLICAKSFAPECEKKYSNITLKKIPQMILGRCEFGKENYDLNIIKATEEIAEDQDIVEE